MFEETVSVFINIETTLCKHGVFEIFFVAIKYRLFSVRQRGDM